MQVLDELSFLRSRAENQGDKPSSILASIVTEITKIEEEEKEEEEVEDKDDETKMDDKKDGDGDDNDKSDKGASEKPADDDDDDNDGHDGDSGKQKTSTSAGASDTSKQAEGVRDSQQETEEEIPTSEAHSRDWGTIVIYEDDGFIREEPAT